MTRARAISRGYPVTKRNSTAYAHWRLITCPKCKAPAEHSCVRVGTTEFTVMQPHKERRDKANKIQQR